MLADLGARVIKVEAPDHGDDSRRWGPPFVAAPGGPRESTYFLAANRNKESITLDLKNPADTRLLRQLIGRADVLVENFRPGVLNRLGFSTTVLAQLNPRLITLSISGFGHDGPEGGRAGYDQIAQAEAGLMSLTGSATDDPQRVGVPVADLLAGMYGAYGVLAALHERQVSGRGQVVRTSLLAAVVATHALHGTAWTVAGHLGRAQGNHHPSIAPYGLFRCRSGAVVIACGNDNLWVKLCDELEIDPRTPGLETNAGRVDRRDHVTLLIEQALTRFSIGEVLARLERAGIPAGRVRSLDEVYAWDQTSSQGLIIEVEHETLGTIDLPGSPLRFFSPGPDGETETTRRNHVAPPALGAANSRVRAWIDHSSPSNHKGR
jgi:crotonobetainyl-CoA:carnitine CoA-transferase CaiB-like acyl-CoA transferase